RNVFKTPMDSVRRMSDIDGQRGRELARTWSQVPDDGEPRNPLLDYFDDHETGPGLWKWRHYFDAYHRHLGKFVATPVTMLEVGIYSGGSLEMWRDYFGPASHIYGVDIASECEVYAGDGVDILIGDQADRTFWAETRARIPQLDVVLDDGGHTPEQQ